MPQRLKDDVRERIQAAALSAFAERGYLQATLADIARGAAIAPSNVYKYYESKAALFDAVVTPADAARLFWLLRARLREFDILDGWTGAHAGGSARARALLEFWVEKRLVVLVLLNGAEGTRFAGVRARIAQEMTRRVRRYVRRHTGTAPAPHLDMVLHEIFAHTVAMVAAILERYASAADIGQAFATFWSYQLAGLEALLKNGAASPPATGGRRSSGDTPGRGGA